MLNLKDIKLPITAETKQLIIDCKAAVERDVESVRSKREKLEGEINGHEQTERELVGRAAALQREVSKSDEAASNWNSVNTRLEAVRRDVASLREKLNSILPATLISSGPAVEAIRELHQAAIDELKAEFIDYLGATSFAKIECNAETIGANLPFVSYSAEATPSEIKDLFARLDLASEGHLFMPEAEAEPQTETL